MGKVGYAFSSNVTAYGTAHAVAGATTNDVFPAPVSPNLFRTNAVHNGWAYGAGIDYRIPRCPVLDMHRCGSSWHGLSTCVNLDEATHNPFAFPRQVSGCGHHPRQAQHQDGLCCGQGPLK
jgi:hypothetical protein